MAGVKIDVKLEGFDEVRRRLADYPARVRNNIMRSGVNRALAVLRKGAKVRVPVKTGALRAAMRTTTRILNGSDVVGRLVAGGAVRGKGKLAGRQVWYAHIVEGGSAPHKIFRERVTPTGGRYIQQINHPGARPRGFLARTATQDLPAASRAFEVYVQQRMVRYVETGK